MKKTRQLACLMIFIVICAAVILFVRFFTESTLNSGVELVSFDKMEFVSDTGERSEFTIDGTEQVRLDGFYECSFSIRDDKLSHNYTLWVGSAELKIYMDGECVYQGRTVRSSNMLSPFTIDFSTGESEDEHEVLIECRYLDEQDYIFPPLVQKESLQEKDSLLAAATNYYAIPAGMKLTLFILLCSVILY